VLGLCAGGEESGCASRARGGRWVEGLSRGGLAWLLLVAGTACPGCSGHAEGQGAGGGEVEGVVVDVGHAAIEGDRFVGQGQGQGDAEVDAAQGAVGAGEFQLGSVRALVFGGVQELRAGGVAAGAAIVVGG